MDSFGSPQIRDKANIEFDPKGNLLGGLQDIERVSQP
jgi:hypothetical protein